jgi:hypothetical protein
MSRRFVTFSLETEDDVPGLESYPGSSQDGACKMVWGQFLDSVGWSFRTYTYTTNTLLS